MRASYFRGRKMPYGLCLFDLDGTLTDPKPGILKSFQYALSALGVEGEAADPSLLIGPPLREAIRGLYGLSEPETERAVAKYREYYSEAGLFENDVYPGIRELLRALADSKVTLAVATSKASVYTNRILSRFGLDGFFSFVSGDELDGSLTKNGKRDIIRAALDALDPGREMRAVMIGDRRHDITGAREMGIDSIGVLWGYGSRDELEAAGATRIAASMEELPGMILS